VDGEAGDIPMAVRVLRGRACPWCHAGIERFSLFLCVVTPAIIQSSVETVSIIVSTTIILTTGLLITRNLHHA
jgi:hypothetical protein